MDSGEPADEGGAAPDFYGMAEAARLKGVSYHTVSRAVRLGKLPHRRVGRMAFVAARDLHAWHPMVQRAPRKFRGRAPDPDAAPALIDLASGDRVELAQHFAILAEGLHAAALDRPLPEFLALLSERLAGALGLTRIALWGIEPGGQAVRRLARVGERITALPDRLDLAEAAAGVGRLFAAESAEVRDLAAFPERPEALRTAGLALVAPLRVGARELGTIVGDRGGRAFALDAEQLAFAQAVANQAALALEVARLRTALGGDARGWPE